MASASDSYADNLPPIIASLVSAQVAAYILHMLFNERELLFALVALATVVTTALRYLAELIFELDDGVVDRFEHANLRPLAFASSVMYFLTVQIGVTLLVETLSMFDPPTTPDLLLAGVVILAGIFYLVPFFVDLTVMAPPTAKKHDA